MLLGWKKEELPVQKLASLNKLFFNRHHSVCATLQSAMMRKSSQSHESSNLIAGSEMAEQDPTLLGQSHLALESEAVLAVALLN